MIGIFVYKIDRAF